MQAPTPIDEAAPVVLGYGPMDSIHAEFDQLVRQADASADVGFHACLLAVIAHLKEHFAEEDAWMTATEFPPRDCHMDEHAAVLRSAAEVEPLVLAGNVAVGRSFVAELMRWFPGHADYLDSALAAWMCKRQYGGRPVVLHRRIDSSV
ncbi:MAG: hemerythrin [Burkholderiaceae bacterium]